LSVRTWGLGGAHQMFLRLSVRMRIACPCANGSARTHRLALALMRTEARQPRCAPTRVRFIRTDLRQFCSEPTRVRPHPLRHAPSRIVDNGFLDFSESQRHRTKNRCVPALSPSALTSHHPSVVLNKRSKLIFFLRDRMPLLDRFAREAYAPPVPTQHASASSFAPRRRKRDARSAHSTTVRCVSSTVGV
jgi:hypothetical protein